MQDRFWPKAKFKIKAWFWKSNGLNWKTTTQILDFALGPERARSARHQNVVKLLEKDSSFRCEACLVLAPCSIRAETCCICQSCPNSNNVSDEAKQALERCHNAHRNTTENTIYFVVLLIPFVFFSPSTMAGYVWVVGFGVARLAYTYSYLNARDNLRGLFMTLGLICMYGLASYLILAILKLL